MRRWIYRYATLGLACSHVAAAALFGERWQEDPRWRRLPYGIDLTAFAKPDRNAVREEFSLPPDCLAVVHAARFVPFKNHAFLIEVADELRRIRPDFRLVLAGDGELRPAIEAEIARRGLGEWVRPVGLRNDVPRLLAGFDLFMMPSHYEGFPVALLEAQAAGLPCLLSSNITSEANVIPGMVRHMELAAGAKAWAGAALEMAAFYRPWTPRYLEQLTEQGYSAEGSRRMLIEGYHDSMASPAMV